MLRSLAESITVPVLCHLKAKNDTAEVVYEGLIRSRNHHPSKHVVSSVPSEAHTTVSNTEIIVAKITRYSLDQFYMYPRMSPAYWPTSSLGSSFSLQLRWLPQTACWEWSLMATWWLGNVRANWSVWARFMPDILCLLLGQSWSVHWTFLSLHV